MHCSKCWSMAVVVAALAVMPGCGSLPPAEETPAQVEVGVAPAPESVEEELVPQLLGPLPPNLAVLEQFDVAVAAMRAGEFDAARETLEELLESNPDVVGAHVNLGITRLRLRDEPGAMQAFETALGLRPQHPVVLNQLAIIERRAGRFSEAQGLYQQALDGQPDYPPLHLNLGILCDLYLRQADCALSHYARYVALGGEQAERVGLWIVDLERRTGKAQ
ncbi:MAG: tetratricopeptide repeat protein [Gammaproteobacteria bacterium]|nr:tetratricopeptide repeat protein [Gammaproteobacteria bacterium]